MQTSLDVESPPIVAESKCGIWRACTGTTMIAFESESGDAGRGALQVDLFDDVRSAAAVACEFRCGAGARAFAARRDPHHVGGRRGARGGTCLRGVRPERYARSARPLR